MVLVLANVTGHLSRLPDPHCVVRRVLLVASAARIKPMGHVFHEF